jgi:hypothetical protein
MEVIIAHRRQNSAVLTYSENGARFPNHGMGSPFEPHAFATSLLHLNAGEACIEAFPQKGYRPEGLNRLHVNRGFR